MTPNKEDTILGAEGFPPWKQNSPSGRRALEEPSNLQTGGPLGCKPRMGSMVPKHHASGELTVSWQTRGDMKIVALRQSAASLKALLHLSSASLSSPSFQMKL